MAGTSLDKPGHDQAGLLRVLPVLRQNETNPTQFLTCLSLTPTSPAKVAFFHGSPCSSDPGGRVPRRKCQSINSPKLNPLGGSSTSGEGMMGPFPKISIERKTASGSLVSLASQHNLAEPKPAAAESLPRGDRK
jgi:hypothetical protein